MAQINKPTDYFDTTLYTGNSSSQTLTMDNVGLLWMKRRDSAIRHCLFDSVRGGYYTGSGDPPLLVSDSSGSAQGTDIDSAVKGITFGATQTVIGNDAGGYSYNTSGHSMVGWQWSASGSTASNTDGSITSTVSANTTSGFSVVSYTGNSTAGATIGHGLGVAPAMFIIKNRNAAEHWAVYHQSISPSNMLYLNLTNAQDPANQFNSTAPTANVFSVSSNIMVNATSNNYIAYCFAEKKGFSKFGSYTGNGSTDGTFVYTGFKPAWVMIKRTDSVSEWSIYDTTRKTFNVSDLRLESNSSSAEDSNLVNYHDILSNGFKMRNTDAARNGSGNSYIYMCFAENPLVGTNNIPATAR